MIYLYFQHLSPRSYCASPPSHTTSRTSVIVLTDIGKFEENQTQKYFVIIIKKTKCNLHKSNRRLLFFTLKLLIYGFWALSKARAPNWAFFVFRSRQNQLGMVPHNSETKFPKYRPSVISSVNDLYNAQCYRLFEGLQP